MGLLSVFVSVLQAQKQPIINCGESRVPHTPCSASTRTKKNSPPRKNRSERPRQVYFTVKLK